MDVNERVHCKSLYRVGMIEPKQHLAVRIVCRQRRRILGDLRCCLSVRGILKEYEC
jgi:hypothetical protein